MANPGIQSDWVERVADALTHLHSEFEKNELAYLALTSKIERQIVDRLAFSLHRKYGGADSVAIAREFTVSKEIQRVDLAVTVHEQPVLFLESKAMNYFHMYFRSAGTKYRLKSSSCYPFLQHQQGIFNNILARDPQETSYI